MQLELNEYIERMSEIKPKLDDMLSAVSLESVVILNNGCSNKMVNQVVKYLQNHGVQVTVESSGASALNRIFG